MKTSSMSFTAQGKWALAWCVAFALAVHQLPLYSSNQHTYFLTGMARAGHGLLTKDWLTHTTDSMPLFSLFVEFVKKSNMELLFNATFMLLAAVYFWAIMKIALESKAKSSASTQIFLAAAIITIHAADQFQSIARSIPWTAPMIDVFVHWCGALHSGVAGQYILGNILQPATFGALILLSIALFIRNRDYLAVLACTAAASFHPTYTLHAAVLVAIYLAHAIRNKEISKAFTMTAVACASISPIAAYVISNLRPTSFELTSIAQNILINERIPHHAKPQIWLHATAVFQYGVIIAGTILARSSRRLFWVMTGATITMTILTAVQITTQNTTLALMFPWRMSVWLVPMSTAILLLSVIEKLNKKDQTHAKSETIANGFLIFFGALSIAFAVNGARRTNQQSAPEELQAVYSSAQKLPPGQWMIPVEMEEFRISTGLPVFVDWKSHPYKDTEVIEWKSRITIARNFYNAADNQSKIAALNAALAKQPVDYVLVPATPQFTQLLESSKIDFIFPEKSDYAILVMNRASEN